MCLTNVFCHEIFVAISAIACMAGLALLWSRKPSDDETEATESILLKMSFSYWLVYCVAFGVQKLIVPDWENVTGTLRLTTTLSYLLTFSCIVCLPLHKFAVHEIEE
ncbi:hypothetical protein [Calothrix sp. UHCC 0171]|uniref:hypothetical protein n=1 Tax=Calothrix sp. UHCC 0171 TaxID=3110245 RepID=UPI002B217A78|nr:hypothetical protein [Calothrix sp. UHCC 0171]MEA5571521.1 hypothetical protein [Calothrix sp. UHCC 0171]